jgi:lysophospholipase L1-like esterase
VIGWGERASLEPHSIFGWRLKPSGQTRLRWESYDYTVTANELGFPGAVYPAHKQPGTIRILTTGDAFTSAEGVDTNLAWPHLLENNLAAQLPDNQVEVLNFAITGYGPNQYTAVVETFAPVYQPDLIIIGFFVNDYGDVLISNEEFQQSIGFGLPAPNSFHITSRLMHLRHFVDIRLFEPLTHALRGEPDPYGYFLGYFITLERNRPEFEVTGRDLVTDRLKKIKTVADQQGAQVVIVMIPAPVQVCESSELAYYPSNVDLTDSTRYDLDLPQRLTHELAEALEIEYYDLRPILQSIEQCPYQPRNSHWTAAGHRAVSIYLTEVLIADGYL